MKSVIIVCFSAKVAAVVAPEAFVWSIVILSFPAPRVIVLIEPEFTVSSSFPAPKVIVLKPLPSTVTLSIPVPPITDCFWSPVITKVFLLPVAALPKVTVEPASFAVPLFVIVISVLPVDVETNLSTF